MEKNDAICAIGPSKTPERQRIALYSRHSFWDPPNRVIILRDDQARFSALLDQQGRIDLARLAESSEFAGAYSLGVSYGTQIDSFIADRKRKTRLDELANLRHPLAMLANRRVDFIFGFYTETAYQARQRGLHVDVLDLAVKGGEEYRRGYVVCSTGPVGQRVIAEVDAILDDPAQLRQFVQPMRDWVDDRDFDLVLDSIRVQ